MSNEKCIFCYACTGNAGRGEDSLFLPLSGPNGDGPFCSNCYRKELIGIYNEVKVELGVADKAGNFLGYGEEFTVRIKPNTIGSFKGQLQSIINSLNPRLRVMIDRDIINDRGEFGHARILEVKIDGEIVDRDESAFKGVEDLEWALTELDF